MQTPLSLHELKSHTTKDIMIEKRLTQDSKRGYNTDRLKCVTSLQVKEEPITSNDVVVDCNNEVDAQHPGWFGKGLRKIKSKKRRK